MVPQDERTTKIPNGVHKSVLLKEIIDGLEIREGDRVVDATVNGGGMSEEILKCFDGTITLVAIDADRGALERAKKRLENFKTRPIFINGNFRNLSELLLKEEINSFNRILFDIGLSSDQLEGGSRGFSFLKNEPLLMTFEETPEESATTAYDIANNWEEENITTIIRSYGEDRNARRIAGAIVEARKIKPITSSKELADVIEKALGRHGKIHPATKTFQAFRIAVNDELGSLSAGISQGFSLLEKGGRMAIISFHSLEDRIVKNFIREKAKEGTGIAITKKPIVPSDEEMTANPRSRSAKLRIIEKV